jgi:hypothetical protein
MMFSTILINREDPCSTDARTLLDRLSATLGFFTGSGGQGRSSVLDVALARARFLAVRTGCGMPLGCGAFRPRGEGIALRCFCAGLARMVSMA